MVSAAKEWLIGLDGRSLILLIVGCVVCVGTVIIALAVRMNRRIRSTENRAAKKEAELRQQVETASEQNRKQAEETRNMMEQMMESVDDSMKSMLGRIELVQQTQSDALGGQLRAVRQSLDERIDQISEENREQLNSLRSSMEELFDQADRKLYMGKANGRDQVVV